MSRIAENLKLIKQSLQIANKLIVVSKYRSTEEILEAYNAGQRIFAENRVQALLERAETLPTDIEWHLIGHLQTNKVKYIAPFIHTIHAVDSEKLLIEIHQQAKKNERRIDCLLQIHIAQEDTKFGFLPDEILTFLHNTDWKSMQNIRIVGLMAMASNTDNISQIHIEFATVNALFVKLKTEYFSEMDYFKELSIGMSSDYKIAIEHGSTMVRIGSAIFA